MPPQQEATNKEIKQKQRNKNIAKAKKSESKDSLFLY